VKERKENIYETFAISRNSPLSESRKLYRELSLKYHPDKNPSEEAREVFMQLEDGIAILKDEERKDYYDYFLLKETPKIDKPTAMTGSKKEYEGQVYAQRFMLTVGWLTTYVAWGFISLAFLGKNKVKTKIALAVTVGALAFIEFTFMTHTMNETFAWFVKASTPQKLTYKEWFIILRILLPYILILIINVFEIFVYKSYIMEEQDDDEVHKVRISEQKAYWDDVIKFQKKYIGYLGKLDGFNQEICNNLFVYNVEMNKRLKKLTDMESEITKSSSKWTFTKIVQVGAFVLVVLSIFSK